MIMDKEAARFEMEYWRQVLNELLELNESILAGAESLLVVQAHVTVARAVAGSIIDGPDPHLATEYNAIEGIVQGCGARMRDQIASVRGILELMHGRATALQLVLDAVTPEEDS